MKLHHFSQFEFLSNFSFLFSPLFVDFSRTTSFPLTHLSLIYRAAGEVFLATNTETSGQVAIKTMSITSDNVKLLCTEIDIMKSSEHENIVQFIDSFVVNNNKLWVVMELMDGGCLTDVLEQFDSVKMSEGQIAHVCLQVCFILCSFISISHIHIKKKLETKYSLS